jgi:hypothetical protein
VIRVTQCAVTTAAEWKVADIVPCFLLLGQLISIGEPQMH